MSSRRSVSTCLAVVSACVLAPAAALAAKHPSPSGRHAVSINVSANPVVAGDPLVIFGRLVGPNNGGRTVVLWHRVNPARGFTIVGQARTAAGGYYEFLRADGVVDSNRSWFVQSLGARSRTLNERVFSLVTLGGPPTGSDLQTGPAHAVVFSGTVSPPRPRGAQVLLQRQSAASGGDDWRTIDRGRVTAGGAFSIRHTFTSPGDANIRVLVRRTSRNLASPSNVLEYQIDQAQNPALTINASADPVTYGQPVVVSGVLAGGATQPVTLLARTDRQSFAPVAHSTTDASGNYAFAAQTPVNSTYYQVQGGGRSSSILFEGVKDALTAMASSSSVAAGQTITFTGAVAPDKTGHVIYLQRRSTAGADFHTVAVAMVAGGSTYAITHRFYDPGTKVLRILIPGGPENQGAASPPITITVTPTIAAALPTTTQGASVGSTTG